MNNQSIIKNSIILASAGIIAKLLGFLFKVPLTRMIGPEGLGLYNYPYTIYAALLALSIGGVPIVVSKLVAEKVALHRYSDAHRIFQITLALMTFVGIFSSFALYFIADYLAGSIWPTNAIIPLRGLLFAPFLMAIMSVFRGYFQGMQMMFAYSLSQVIEALGRFIFGLYFANILLEKGIEYSAAGGTFGATIGAFLGCISLVLFYLYKKSEISSHKDEFLASENRESTRSILKHLLKLLIPVSLGALAVTIMPLIDSLIVKNSLLSAGILEEKSTILFGNLGATTTLINFPLTITYALSVTLIPTIANSSAKGHDHSRKEILSQALKITFYLMLPAATGIYILSNQILSSIFPTLTDALWLLRFSSLTIIVISINQIVVATLQGLGLFMKPVKNIFIGAFLKVITSYALMQIPQINILGAVIGTFIGYSVTTYRSSKSLIEVNVLDITMFSHIWKPLLGSCFMGIFLYLSISILNLNLLLNILIASIIYLLVMDFINAINIRSLILKFHSKYIK